MSDIAATSSAAVAAQAPSDSGQKLWSKGGFGFKDLLDIVNPLQHLPVIGSVYRYLTGDEPSGGARIVGDALYGGPIGLGVGVVSSMLSDSQGHDVGEQMLAKVFGSHDDAVPPTAVASATQTSAPASFPPTPIAAARPNARTIASAAAPTTPGASPFATPTATSPVDMTGLYKSASVPGGSAAKTPEDTFLSQRAQFQQQLANGRAPNGQVVAPRAVPLELPGNLQTPQRAPIARPAAAATANQAAPATVQPPDPNNPVAIPQKMLEALDKYSQMKKQQNQDDSAKAATADKVDLSL